MTQGYHHFSLWVNFSFWNEEYVSNKITQQKTRSTFNEIHPSKNFYPSHPQTKKTVPRYLWLGYFPGKPPENWRIWGSFIPITRLIPSIPTFRASQWPKFCKISHVDFTYLSGCTHFFTQFLSILSFFRGWKSHLPFFHVSIRKNSPLNAHEWRPCTMLVPETVEDHPICKHPKTTWSSWKYSALK